MKRVITVLGIVAALFVAAVLWYRWDSGTNHGYRWGYWGQFNTVSNALAKIPGVTIVKFGCNADVTMEEFGFDVTTQEGRQVHVWFSETDPIRKLSGEALSRALIEKIRKESSNKPAAGSARPVLQSAIVRRWPGVPEPER
ncbi:MAG TPA: hypothetical protein VN673_07845 [Clostridia bacterium]|nr:hypothetical protein [Clostridia bacterium]